MNCRLDNYAAPCRIQTEETLGLYYFFQGWRKMPSCATRLAIEIQRKFVRCWADADRVELGFTFVANVGFEEV